MKKFIYGQLIFIFLFSFCNTLFGQITNYKVEYSLEHYIYDRPNNDTNDDDFSELRVRFATSGIDIYNEQLSFGSPTEDGLITVFDDVITTPNPETTISYFYDTECPENNWQPFNISRAYLSTGCREDIFSFPIDTWSPCTDFVHNYSRVIELPSSLILPNGDDDLRECEPFTIQVADCDIAPLSYALEYTLTDPVGTILDEGELAPYSLKSSSFTFDLADITGLNPNDLGTVVITARYVADPNTTIGSHRTPVSLTPRACSIELRDTDPIQIVDAACNSSNDNSNDNSNDGSITLNFKNNVETNFGMRYFIFQGDYTDFTGVVETVDGTTFPNQVFDEVLFNPNSPSGPLVPNGDGTYRGTYSQLDGTNTNSNPPPGEENQQNYYIIYQEVDYNSDPVIVKSGELIEQTFTIRQPTEISISIPANNITQPLCSGDLGEVTVVGLGGGFAPNPNAALQYGIQKDGGTIDWPIPTSSTFSVLDAGDYIFYARTSTTCVSIASQEVTIDAVPVFEFDTANTRTGQDPSPGGSDGSIEVELNGGTANITLGIYNDAANPTLVQSTTLTGNTRNHIFTGLPAGTYYLRAIDANPCTITSPGTYELQSAPIPDLQVPVPIAPFCNNGTDGEVSVALSGTIDPYQYRILDAGSSAVDSGNGTTSPITVTNLSPGNFSIEVIYNTGSFNTPATVATRSFTILNPAELTISLIEIVGLDCNGSTDGYIEILSSEAGDFEYSYRNLGSWIALNPNMQIPITQAGLYNDLMVRKTPRLGDIVFCTSNEIDDIFVPAGIAVTEVLASHQDASSNGGNDGVIVIDVTGGTPGTVPNEYTFTWSGTLDIDGSSYSNTTQNISNLSAGTYQVIVTDANTCTATLVQAIRITEPGPLSIQSFTGTNTCNGLNTGTTTAAVQGTGDITFEFLLQPGAGETVVYAITTANRTVIAPDLAAGTYGLRITEVTSTTTITTPVADYFTINELAPITATVTPTDLACNETNTGIITITGASGGSNTGFEYAIDDGFGFQAGNTFTNLPPRVYVITIRDDLGCEFSTTVDIIQAGAPIINDLTTVITNASSAANLDGSIVLEFETDPTNYTYAWSGPGVTGVTTKDLDLIAAGTYQVIVSAPGNCTLTRNFTVGVQAAFSIQSFTGTPTCFNQSNGSLTTTIEATGLVTFNWILDDGTVNGNLVASETTNLRTLSTAGLAAGNYYLEIVDTNSLSVQSGLFEIIELPEVSATVIPVPTCLGSDTGTITFSNPIGSPSNSYTYSVDNGLTFQASPIFENLSAGSYDLRVSIAENNNCDFIVPGVTITTSPGIFWDEPNTQITRASGAGASDGAIAPVFTGGTVPLAYQWSANANNATTQNITGLAAGIYTVTVTDAANCSITQNIEVTEVGPLTISNITPTNVLCRGEANGSITTTVTGEGTITYLWTLANGDPVPVSNGVTEQNITGILVDSYILTATDDNATISTSAVVIGEPATTVTITNITPTDVSCFGGDDGALEILAEGGSGPYAYSINGGTFQASPIFTNLLANSYTVRVQDVNACEFAEPTPVLILEPQELNLIINEQRPVTAANETNGAIFITVEGGSNNYTYEWSGPNGYLSTDEDILDLAAGNYSVTITDANFAVSNDAGCRLTSALIAITEPGQLIANLTQTVFLECSGDAFAEITANVQGGVSPFAYEWFQVNNGNNSLLNEDTDIIGNLSAGTYFVRATDANSITIDSNPISITAPTQVEITVDNTTNVLCTGQPTGSINITVLGGTPPYQYFWSNSATVADISGLDAGDYTIEVEDAAGCITQNTITITAPDDAVQITDFTINNVSAYQALDGSVSVNISGGLAPYTYIWTRLSDISNAGNQATISNLAADSYSVSVSDSNGCTVTETYEVTQPDIIEETIVQPSCSGDSDGSITVLVNQGNGTFTYLWNTGATENSINNVPAGSYTVTVTGFVDGPVSRTYLLENPVPLEVNLGLDRVLCANQTLELDATVNDATASYFWTSDNGFASTAPNVTLSETGNYTVTVQSQTGCTTQGAIFVDISTDEIDAEFAMSSQVFTGETVVAVDISYPLPDGIEWIVPIGAEIISQDKDAAEFSFAEAGEYEITVITTRGDCIAQKTKKILVVAMDGLIQEDAQNGQKLVEEFIVYPNPTTGRFTADINLTERGDVSVKVFSFANNTLMASERGRAETSYSIPFDISGMPSGVYAVLLETPYGTSLRKIIVR